MQERIRKYLRVVGIPNLVVVLALIAVCLAWLLIGGYRLSALASAIGEGWFVLHAAPVEFDGVILGTLPLLPPIAVVSFIAWRVRTAIKEQITLEELYALAVVSVLVPLTLSGLAWFMVWDAQSVFPVVAPNPLKALFIPVFVHLVGVAAGLGVRQWRGICREVGAPEWIVDGVVFALTLCGRIFMAAAVVFTVALLASSSRVSELVSAYPQLDAGGVAGVTLVSFLYLPNAVIGTAGVMLGAPFEFGQGSVSLFSATHVPLPPLPLFGALPPSAAVWAPVLLLIPMAVLVHATINRPLTPEVLGVTVAACGLIALAAALMAGGVAGAYGWVGADPWIVAVAAVLWSGAVGGLTWVVARFTQ